ncbi:helix-turn-helix domain-containing protein [Flavobacterium sp. MC2016-06]|jgi:AraC family transcriptional activator of pobA|uniref:helix-turn-helix domain-containing protein n=1 Tax=Flavobacterium sp. MC2016-06 TaxID=2676308 RepID=UPI0012BABC97|nr:helix-turn-helix domain-containing protein [Flavobacterium sp. MC2016-06]MBU3857733.1 helix-turn-helix domain-containing protein [Flavobacterium sp. MC2016-06]
MIKEYKEKSTLGHFIMHLNNESFKGAGILEESAAPIITFVYNKGESQQVTIDEIVYTLPAAATLPLVSNQHFLFEDPDKLIAWQFNREFYCIVNHDAEVGCVGFLFYGIHHPMFIQLDATEKEAMSQLEKIFSAEWLSNDNFQGEMLRTLLKQLIIKTTRTAKLQNESYQEFPDEKMDIVRNFMLVIEGNFKKEHSVSFYAAALNKSPKTLSNIFSMLKQPPPSKLIQNRIVLEAKRYLHYTNKSAKEIAFELGFESPAHFSRFFKMYSGINVSEFKNL